MDLAHDLFEVTAEQREPSDSQLVAAVERLGYKAAIRAGPADGGAPSAAPAGRGNTPALVQAALDQARREGKLVLVDFYAEWCGPCQRMLKETFPDPQVVAAMAGFVFLKVDTDQHPDVSRWFGVQGIPDARVLEPSGRELRRAVGFKAPDQMVAFLKGE